MKKYTLSYKHIICPIWNCEVTLSAKYYLDESNEHIGEFTYAECPIVENSKLPERKQDKRLSCYPSCRIYPYDELSSFSSKINI